MNTEQLLGLGQVDNPGVNFTSVHGLTPVIVHLSSQLPRGNLVRRVTPHCLMMGNPPCRGNFAPCGQKAKIPPGQE